MFTLVALLLPLVAFVAHLSRLGHWLVDDALISVAYARTLSDGGGFAQQLGAAPVEGVSNPSWTLLLAGLRAVGLFDQGRSWHGIDDTVLVVRALAIVLFLLTLIAGRAVAAALLDRPLDRDAATLLAGLVLAGSPVMLIWAASGLENPLYGWLTALLAALLCTETARGRLGSTRVALFAAGLALGLSATRPDGVIFAAAYPATVLLTSAWAVRTERSLRPVVRATGWAALSVGCFAVPAGALLVARHAVFGRWVPNTAVAKDQGGLGWSSALRATDLVSAAGLPAVVLAVLAAVVLIALRGRSGPAVGPLTPLLAGFLLACAGFCVLKTDWMAEYRFATPSTVLGAMLLAILVVGAAARIRAVVMGRSARTRLAAVLVAVALVVPLGVGSAVSDLRRTAAFAHRPTVSGCFVADRFGRTFDLYADDLGIGSGSLLVPDIGGALLTSRLRVVDLAGLTEPRIAEFRRSGDSASIRDYVFDRVRPTFLHLHRPWDAGIRADPRLARDYRPIVPGADYVRRDAATAVAVRSLRPAAIRLTDRLDRDRARRPLAGCGAMVPGSDR